MIMHYPFILQDGEEDGQSGQRATASQHNCLDLNKRNTLKCKLPGTLTTHPFINQMKK